MAEASDRHGILYQNLVDAGCDEETIKQCEILFLENRIEKIPALLAPYRAKLLDTVRALEKEIDSLDFLLFQIKKKQL